MRVVEVDYDWYIKLMEHLKPEERWIKDFNDKFGLILWTWPEYSSQVIFVPKKEVEK